MLLSMYVGFGIISFLFLLFGFFHDKKLIRFILHLVSLVMFAGLAIASLDVVEQQCGGVITQTNESIVEYASTNNTITTYKNDMICTETRSFDQAAAWFYAGFAILAGALVLINGVAMATMKEDDL